MKLTNVIFWIIGIVLLAVGGYMLVKEKLFLLTAGQATAIVTGNERQTYQSNENGTQYYYCSAFQFQTKDGRSISFNEDDSTDVNCTELDMPPDYQVGEQVPIYYDPRDPANTVQIPKSVSLDYKGGVIVLVLGCICIVVGIILFWIRLVKNRRAAASRR
jgi:hypothetical protein